MGDYGEIRAKKGIGCLGVFLIILLILALIAGSFYYYLPKIISSAVSGGKVSKILPENFQNNTNNFQNIISDYINQLETFGLSKNEAIQIISSMDFTTFEKCLEDIQKSPISNSTDLIDKVSEYFDLKSANLEKIKKDNYTEFKEEELNLIVDDIKESPIMGRSVFRIIKETVIEVLKAEN